jgi:hypothetical protein
VHVRLQLSPDDIASLSMIAHETGATLSAVARVSMHLIATGVLDRNAVVDAIRAIIAENAEPKKAEVPPDPRRRSSSQEERKPSRNAQGVDQRKAVISHDESAAARRRR